MTEQPKSLIEAIRYFSDEQTCIDAVAALRWNDGKPVCPHCENPKSYWLATQKRWKCAGCRKQYSVKVGTIFEDSALGLDKWLVTLWLLCNCKNGVSSYEIARDVEVTQKSAWFMLQRLRLVLKNVEAMPIGSKSKTKPVEIDECYLGGKPKNMHRSRRAKIGQNDHKTAVLGMLERGGEVRAMVVPNAKKDTLQPIIHANVKPSSVIYTDGATVYDTLRHRKNYTHETVNHIEEYVRGDVHTQSIENFWSCLKRTLGGTYVAVEPVHLDHYLDEQVWRFNNRHKNDGQRFTKALGAVTGKRLTWGELTGKEELPA